MLSLTEVATMLRCHPNTVRSWVRRGKLIAVPMGEEQVNMFRKEDVVRLKKPLEEAGVIIKDDKQAFPVVGIGASAGGLDAMSRLLKHLPTDLGLAYVFITHQEKEQEKTLSDLLRKKTAMPVFVVENGMRLEPDRLYVNPSNMHTAVVNGTFTMQAPRGRVDAAARPIDAFFRALANEYQNNAIGIVLSGGGMDGTEGLRAIKAEDGLTIVQDDSAQDPRMPQSAREADVVDLVRKPEDMGRELAELVKQLFPGGKARIPSKHENEMRRILQFVLEQRGVDFTEYKETTIHRRIIRRMVLSKCRKLSEYSALLRGVPTELDTLYSDLLINVTSFFRDPAFYKALSDRVLPELFRDRSGTDPLRIWVPACAGGEEVVSIAITLLEFLGERAISTPVQVFATDLNERTIEKARLGIYKKSALQDMERERVGKYFMHVDGHYQVIKPIRDMCVFAKHDLLKDPPFSRVDLISCQNVLIYLENAAQGRILKAFHYALKPAGFLFLGKSETPANAGDIFMQPDREHKVYLKKRRGGGRLDLDLHFKPTPVHSVPLGVPVPPSLAAPHGDLDRETEQLLLHRYVPASVLVNKDLEIVRFLGATAPFLGPSTGRASLSLLKMVRDDMAFELRSLLQKARKEKIPMRKSGIPIRLNNGLQDVGIEVLPMGGTRDPHFLVLFREEGVATPATEPAQKGEPGKRAIDARDKRIALLEQELREAREQVRLISEEAEINTQELQAANEEVVSSNEELQSINEELETSKEELQSINEEFATINEELQARNDALREIQERLELATRTGRVGIWDWDVVADRITWSDSHYAIHGVQPDTFAPTVKGFTDLVHPDDRERVGRAIGAALRNEAHYELEFRSVKPDGSVLWLFTNASVVRANGKPIRMLGATLDITDLKAAEEALRQRTYALERMNAMGDTLIAELDTEKIVQAVTDTGREVAGAAFGAFFHNVTNAEGKSYMLYTLSGLPREAFANFPMPRATDLFGPTFRGEGVLRIDDVRKDPRYGHMAPYQGMPKGHAPVASYLAVPVTSRDGKVLGGLFFGHPEPARFTREAEEMITTLAAQAALAIDNADLHTALQRELEQQRISALALRESEKRYRQLMDTLPAAVYTCDTEGCILLYNPAAAELWGRAPDLVKGQWHGAHRLFSRDGAELTRETSPMARAIKEGRSLRDEVIIERPDGTRRHALVHPEPIRDASGTVIGGHNVLIDITDRVQIEHALATSEERFRAIYEHASFGIILNAVPDGRIADVNPAFAEMVGWSRAEMLGKTSLELGFNPDPEARKRIMDGIINTGSARDLEVDLMRRDGTRLTVRTSADRVTMGGEPYIMAIFENITERRLGEERLRIATATGKLGIWDWDVLADTITWTDPVYEIHGVVKGAFIPSLAGYSELIHPDDRERVGRAIKAALHENVPYEVEFRTLNDKGEVNWVFTNAVVLREHGKPVRMLGGTMNITQRKLAEEAARRLAAIVESSDDAILSRDIEGIITSWNKGAERIFGYTAEEIVGRSNHLLYPPDKKEEEELLLDMVRKGQRVEHYETVRLHKDGKPVDVALTLSPLKNDKGEIIGASKVIRDITADKRAREIIRQSEERFHLLADNVVQLIWMAEADGSTMWFNKRWEEFTGMSGEQIRLNAKDLHHPDHHERVSTSLRARAEKGEQWEETFPLKGKDGKFHWFLATARPVRDPSGNVVRWFGTLTDITTEREAGELLRESEERFRLLADSMAQLAWIGDAEGKPIWYNKQWENYSGIDMLNGTPEQRRMVMHPDHMQRVNESHMRGVSAGVVWEETFPLLGKDGQFRWFLSRSVPVRAANGELIRWFGTNTDITEQKKAEEELESSSRHKDHFLATLAHELRNPLAPIKNGLQLMELAPDDPGVMETTRAMMTRQLDHMVRLVDDLMDLSRISRGKIELLREQTSLSGIVATAIESCKPLIERNAHQLEVNMGSDNMVVNGDAARLTQVVANLLNNAAKYTPKGGRIQVNVEREGNTAVIRVKDNGIGIEPEAISHAFDMFAQIDPAQKTQAGGGLGIGLNIVKQLVEMHDGKVEGQSAGLGQGSEFTVRLPLLSGGSGPAKTSKSGTKSTGPSRRVLVVDDNQDAALSMSLILRRRGHTVEVANDGGQALALGGIFKPEIVLMDIGMPRMNGYEACARMRGTEWGKHIRIVALSGWGQDEDRRRSEEAGFDGHTVKPIDSGTLDRLMSEEA
ncbi:MAG: PAS domain S-box protein [Flavobacteriales bacterium]